MTVKNALNYLVASHRDVSHERMAARTHGAISRQRWFQLENDELKSFPQPSTIQAIALGLGVPAIDVVLACAESLGISIPSQRDVLDLTGVDDSLRGPLRQLVRAAAAKASDADLPRPDDEVAPLAVAARSLGRGGEAEHVRRAQDHEGEQP